MKYFVKKTVLHPCERVLALVVLLMFAAPCVLAQGILKAWGANSYGELGDGTTTNRSVPVEASGLTNVVAVAAGGDFFGGHSLALKSDGTVWAWGRNGYGQLGNGSTANNSTVPVPVSGLTNVAAVAGRLSSSLALKSDGTVWAWGYNGYGQLGDGTFTDSSVPVAVTGLTGVVAVAGGGLHSLALRADGTVWAWGLNDYGQLGNGSTAYNSMVPVPVSGLTGVVAIDGGMHYSIAVKSDGTVWAWGRNDYGQLGVGSTATCRVPVPVSGLTGVVAVAAGYFHSLALKSDGTVWAWGANVSGQLGNGSTAAISTVPVPVSGLTGLVAIAGGMRHSIAVKSDGTVWAWGWNGNGELGNGSTATNSTVPVPVSGLTGVVAVAGGGGHSIALTGQCKGVDVSNWIGSQALWTSFKQAGWTFVIARAAPPQGLDNGANPQLANARAAGMKTAAYCYMNFNDNLSVSGPGGAPKVRTGGWQILKTLVALGSEAAYVSFIAIDVEPGDPTPVYAGNMTFAQRMTRIREAVQAIREAGLTPIIYTTRSAWSALTGNNSDSDIAALPLWDANPNETASLLPFTPYGGWSTRQGKQYSFNTGAAARQVMQQFNLSPTTQPIDLNTFQPDLFVNNPPPLIPIVTLTKANLNAGVSTTGTLLLSGPLPSGNVIVTLSTSDATIAAVPASVTIPAGTRTATFPVATNATLGGVLTISASVNGIKTTATLTVIGRAPLPIRD